MKKSLYAVVTLIVILSILSLFVSGCATISSLMPSISDREWPKKRVMVMSVTNLSNLSLDASTDVSNDLARGLRNTGFFTIHQQDEPKGCSIFESETKDNLDFLKQFSDMGMNAIVCTRLYPIDQMNVRSGIWPLRKKSKKFTAILNITIFDAYRKTVILNKDIIESIKIPFKDLKATNENILDIENKKPALMQCLPDMLKRSVKAIYQALNDEIWEGKIISVDTETITINAGRDAGLKQGTMFVVLKNGQLINTYNGKTYPLAGEELGRIKIVELKQRTSIAKPLTTGKFKAGQIIRVRE
ncbi:MAG: hypothetical protein JXA79_00035 [Deltaproteobacteria bacterium]|nr:hypothetical protein [Deltaproteobacteria bacterium]